MVGDGQYYRERPRGGLLSAVVARFEDADAAERELLSAGRCNWITGYSHGFNEYCGRPARSGVCAAHAYLVAIVRGMED
jgi:hypothetical protein